MFQRFLDSFTVDDSKLATLSFKFFGPPRDHKKAIKTANYSTILKSVSLHTVALCCPVLWGQVKLEEVNASKYYDNHSLNTWECDELVPLQLMNWKFTRKMLLMISDITDKHEIQISLHKNVYMRVFNVWKSKSSLNVI